MRIAFVNPIGQVGGAELSLLDLLATLPAALPGVERHLVLLGDGPLRDRAEALGVSVHVAPMPEALAGLGDSALRGRGRFGAAIGLAARGLPAAWAARSFAKGLRTILRDLKPDLIHTNGLKAHLLAHVARVPGVPVVWHVRDFPGARPVMAKALRWAARGAAGAIAISEAVARDVQGVAPALPVAVVYNAIDVDRFAPGPGDGPRLDALAELPPAPSGTVRVGLVATYARWKGQDLFLQAAGRVVAESLDTPARFYVIGGPIYKTRGSQFSVEELRAMADGLGLGDRVGFVPFQSDPADAFRALDVVVHASTQPEPFGRTIVEAMACGRAVVVARAGGAAELFRDDEDAVGVPPGDPDALASAIGSLLADPSRRDRLGDAARQTALARFARDRLGREVATAYERFQGTSHWNVQK
ncbi:MAG TPA: glycosyltransferase family 4 protein [Isosphaeraceae bacterium]|jgi:glycosyltransferase involved in cell wall biosynthesis|nr:glycosyltransferase family 4 protein [Isosphaeraceae bacterium]